MSGNRKTLQDFKGLYLELIEACERKDDILIYERLSVIKKELDFRYVASENLFEFFTYCQSLAINNEFDELARLLQGKLSSNVQEKTEGAVILDLNKFRKVI